MLFGAEKKRRERIWCGDIVWIRSTPEAWGGRPGQWGLVTEVNAGNVSLSFPPKPGSTTWTTMYQGFNQILLEPEARIEAAMKGEILPEVPDFPEHVFQKLFASMNEKRAEREGLQLVLSTRGI